MQRYGSHSGLAAGSFMSSLSFVSFEFLSVGVLNPLMNFAGDSGGPLIIADSPDRSLSSGNPDFDTLVAITSFGPDPCNVGDTPGGYTLVGPYRDWIDTILESIPAQHETTPESIPAQIDSAPNAIPVQIDSPPDSIPEQGTKPTRCSEYHTIVAGDLCFRLWTTYKISRQEFDSLNPDVSCTNLQVGSRVCVAGETKISSPIAQTCKNSYIIVPGDICFDIWARFGITETKFRSLNPGVDCDNLEVGGTLCLS